MTENIYRNITKRCLIVVVFVSLGLLFIIEKIILHNNLLQPCLGTTYDKWYYGYTNLLDILFISVILHFNLFSMDVTFALKMEFDYNS